MNNLMQKMKLDENKRMVTIVLAAIGAIAVIMSIYKWWNKETFLALFPDQYDKNDQSLAGPNNVNNNTFPENIESGAAYYKPDVIDQEVVAYTEN